MIEAISDAKTALQELGLNGTTKAHWNLSPAELVEYAIKNGEGKLCDNGALAADTGKFTGRSPKDKFLVCDDITENSVWWGDINIKFTPERFDALYNKVINHINGKEIFVRDAYACALPEYRLNVRVVTESAFQNLFANNLFLRPNADELKSFAPDWHVIAAPSFMADPEVDGTRQSNFAIINFTKKIILIGGTAYTGEIKKGIFTVLNFVMPHDRGVLSMHCSANVGKDGDTAVFFGLSGTGKTTLSSDPDRGLIGDDEHGWDANNVFNFEGGCYAKVINLSAKNEPQIYNAIKFGALVENINFIDGSRSIDYADGSKTENTRTAYPLDFIDNALLQSVGKTPKNIFFLTADAFGVLPPISRLTKPQAMYLFISGYTAKVAGTEAGVSEPQPTFSACFGAAFLPLHPTKYAEMLGKKMDETDVKVWLINTGWVGGGYGEGNRISLPYTRALIAAALEGKLDNANYQTDPIFGLSIPKECANVPSDILYPRDSWADKNAYDEKAKTLAGFFNKNFEKYASFASDEIKGAAPKA
ncbi:MAG: phosphoenolpyruvate carboxykinase (ATP) [Bacteroidetes bacterium]|nr:phosphoenolpyruvate carboxykinase (ATP) [Bacteroidota bacterium]